MAGNNVQNSNRKAVYVIRENKNGGKDFWVKVGIAFVNKDGSLNLHLDALPLDGKLQVRDFSEREESSSR